MRQTFASVDDHIEIPLERGAWSFIVEQLRRWAAVNDQIAEDPRQTEDLRQERRESARRDRHLADRIAERLINPSG